MTKQIIVGPNQYALVDDDDYERLYRYSWCIAHMQSGFYAVRSVNRKRVYMHHDIIGKPPVGKVTDHKNRQSLDNRKENLHHVTYSENRCNTTYVLEATHIHKVGKKYRARPSLNGKKVHLGNYRTYEEAQQAVERFFNGN